nr:hypothetical protein [Tanacetum cinerariifolium]
MPYVPEPVYPEYIPVENEVFPTEEQPLPAAASPTTDSPGYIPESDPDEDPEEMMMRRRSTQLRPTLFHLHLHSVSRLGYLSDLSHRHYPSPRRMLRASPPILPIPLPTASPPLQLLSSDRRADRPEVTLPPRKRLSIVHRPGYKAGESSTAAAAARPIEGRRTNYGFVGSVEAEIRRRIAKDIGYGIRDAWIDPRDIVEEEALTTLEGVNTRVTKLAAGYLVTALGEIQALQAREQTRADRPEVTLPPRKRLSIVHCPGYEAGESSAAAAARPMEGRRADYGFVDSGRQTEIFQRVKALVDDSQYHYETGRLVDQEAIVSREDWAHSIGLSSRHLVTALGEIRALQAMEQARAGAPKGAGSST